ncbi:MAG: hypothetical protein WBY53_06990 [Acidobacteriaceae bacterium]
MEPLKRSLALVVLLPAIAAPSLTQTHPVTQPKKQTDSGPSLDVTTKFIQDELNAEGEVNYAAYIHDNQSGSDEIIQYSYKSIDPQFPTPGNKCSAVYTFISHTENSSRASDLRYTRYLYFQGMQKLQVMPANSWWEQEMADESTPTKSVNIQPNLFVLSFGRPVSDIVCEVDGKPVKCVTTQIDRIAMTWSFRDQDTANSVAKAVMHAVELCGGGHQDPF